MNFSCLASCAERVARRGGRLSKIEALAELLTGLDSDLVGPSVQMLAGELPGGKIGVGFATVRTAREAAEPASGLEPVSIRELLDTFDQIRGEAGAGSKQRRVDRLTDLFERGSDTERNFLGRLLVGELRQGALTGLMIEAIAQAANVAASGVRRAVMISGRLDDVAVAALSGGEVALADFRVKLFRPLQPMLASPAEGPEVVVERISTDRLALEVKIDGARVQVHREGDDVRIYSRQLHDVTHAAPELVELARQTEHAQWIADGETFAIRADGSIHPFQTTMRRFGRSRNVDELRRRLPLEARFFDLLLLGDEELIDEPLEARWQRLEGLFPDHQAPRWRPPVSADVQKLFDQALDDGHEGLMAKDLDSAYAAGSRGFQWLKLKPTHTLDLVVLAVEKGSGRRSGWLSNLHLGAVDPDNGGFVMLGKTFKGLTDDMLRWQTEHLGALETHVENGYVHHVRPELVVEIAYSNLQKSPQYPAGIALRFARVKAHRPDRDATSAATIHEVQGRFEAENGRPARPVATSGSAEPSGDSNA